MRKIAYANEELLTTDAIADAVLIYAGALARAGTSEPVTIPIVTGSGEPDEATLLLGPASQLTVIPDGSDETRLPGASAALDDLLERTRKLEPDPITDPSDPGDLDAANVFPSLGDYE